MFSVYRGSTPFWALVKFLLGGHPHDRSRNLKLSSLDKLKISRSSISRNGGSGLVEVTRLLNGRNLPSS